MKQMLSTTEDRLYATLWVSELDRGYSIGGGKIVSLS